VWPDAASDSYGGLVRWLVAFCCKNVSCQCITGQQNFINPSHQEQFLNGTLFLTPSRQLLRYPHLEASWRPRWCHYTRRTRPHHTIAAISVGVWQLLSRSRLPGLIRIVDRASIVCVAERAVTSVAVGVASGSIHCATYRLKDGELAEMNTNSVFISPAASAHQIELCCHQLLQQISRDSDYAHYTASQRRGKRGGGQQGHVPPQLWLKGGSAPLPTLVQCYRVLRLLPVLVGPV